MIKIHYTKEKFEKGLQDCKDIKCVCVCICIYNLIGNQYMSDVGKWLL